MFIRAIRGRKDISAERTHGTFWQRRASHRWHGCSQIRRLWHPCHTHAAKFCVFCEFCVRTAHPNHLCQSVSSVGEKIFPQNARNTRNLLAEKSLPQMSTDVHRLGGYGIPAIPTLPNSVYSVNSVGEQCTPTICVDPLSMLISKCFGHYFHFKLRFYILG